MPCCNDASGVHTRELSELNAGRRVLDFSFLQLSERQRRTCYNIFEHVTPSKVRELEEGHVDIVILAFPGQSERRMGWKSEIQWKIGKSELLTRCDSKEDCPR
jgi:hypothetical protein